MTTPENPGSPPLGALAGFAGDLGSTCIYIGPDSTAVAGGLSASAGSAGARLRAFCVLGNRAPCGFSGYHEILLSLFGGDFPPQGAPLAALLAHGAGMASAGPWVLATPVRLIPGQGGVILARDLSPQLDDESVLRYQLRFQSAFEDRGLHFASWGGSGWLVRVESESLPRFASLDAAMGRDLAGLLPSGKDRLRWHGLLNEAQMLLHEPMGGEAPFNGLWFWGAGRVPRLRPGGLAGICGGGEVARAVAGLAGVAWDQQAPNRCRGWVACPGPGQEVMLLQKNDRCAEWVLVLSGAGERFEYRDAHRWRFWRRWATPALSCPAGI